MQDAKTETMAGQNGPGDDSGNVDSGSNGLGNNMGTKGQRRAMADDRRGDDRANSVADSNAGETTGSGEGDSQDGSKDSLRRRL